LDIKMGIAEERLAALNTEIDDKVIRKDGRVIHTFVRGSLPYWYKGSIILPEERYNLLTPEDIEQIKEKRYTEWLAIVNPLSEPNA